MSQTVFNTAVSCGQKVAYLTGNGYTESVDSMTHPYTCQCFAWSRCFMSHAKDFITRKNMHFFAHFEIQKFDITDDDENFEIKSLKVKFYGNKAENWEGRSRKALKNLVKICSIYKMLQINCKEEIVIEFS